MMPNRFPLSAFPGEVSSAYHRSINNLVCALMVNQYIGLATTIASASRSLGYSNCMSSFSTHTSVSWQVSQASQGWMFILCKEKLSTFAPTDLAPSTTFSANILLLPFPLGLSLKTNTYLLMRTSPGILLLFIR